LDRELVFTEAGQGVTKIYNSGWKVARRRASERYEHEFGTSCPPGFRHSSPRWAHSRRMHVVDATA
jgi:hypothetical protein